MTNRVLKNIHPLEVFKYFEEISQIPRGPGNEKNISDYLVSFAKMHNLEFIQDSALNVIIKKKASLGYENSPTVIIQGHMDMICEKDLSVNHDFSKDPLKLRIIDDMVYATNTTLGADNGIAVSLGLAILASENIAHPAVELLLTTFEERGMYGAKAVDPKGLDGKILINIDSEDEGKLFVGCAGEVTAHITIPATWENTDNNLIPCAISIRGLKGGHSGMEIHKGRANSNKLLGRILFDFSSTLDFRMNSLNGGMKQNAITRESNAYILLKPEDIGLVKSKLYSWEETFKKEFRISDPDIKIDFDILPNPITNMLSKDTQNNVIDFLYLCPHGVNSISLDIEGLVESSQNTAVVTTSENEIVFIVSIRSSIRSLRDELFNKLCILARLLKAKISIEFEYPEWPYNPNSKIRKIFEEVYTNMYGHTPEVTALHAGLECGLFSEKISELDIISFGPDVYDVHTPNEHISISSVERTWNYLLEVLKNIK